MFDGPWAGSFVACAELELADGQKLVATRDFVDSETWVQLDRDLAESMGDLSSIPQAQ